MKYNCSHCGKEFELELKGFCGALAMAFCEECGKEFEKTIPKELLEKIKKQKEEK